jgi:SAM-dependent methyltransferase
LQNIYDDPRFFAGYRDLRDNRRGLNDVLEQPALRMLLPPLADLDVLDLGCGDGSFARWCVEQGARRVVGVDLSQRMLALAAERTRDARISFLRGAIEQVAFGPAAFDLVVSSYALHYVEDYAGVAACVFDWLRPGGSFVFSIEHPVMTAQVAPQDWVTDHVGRRLFWALDDYADEGERRSRWFVDGVLKYHRRADTLVNGLLDAGFVLTRMCEPAPPVDAPGASPTLLDNRRRPPVLLLAARTPV